MLTTYADVCCRMLTEQGAEDMVKRNESAVSKVEAFRKYRAQMLEATRERFKIMRRLNVTYSRSLAKRVRSERGVTPDEFAQQRAFFIKEHEKQLDSIRDEAKVQVQEARHKLEWTMKEERATMKAKLESELAAAEERARALRESLEKTVTEKHNAKVRIMEEQLASALDRLDVLILCLILRFPSGENSGGAARLCARPAGKRRL
jgi:hypothetical protein